MQKFLLSFILLIAIVSGYLFIGDNKQENSVVTNDNDFAKKTVMVSKENPVKSTPKTEVKKTQQKKEEVFVRKDVFVSDAFEDVEVTVLASKMEHKKGVSPLFAFNMKKDSIKNLRVNDHLELPELEGAVYDLRAETRTVNKNGSVTIKASIEGEDRKYYTVLTEGESVSFITAYTPEGVYEFEMINGSGYVYRATDINNARIDYSHSDGVAVPH